MDTKHSSLLARIGADEKAEKEIQSTEAESALREEQMMREGQLNRSKYSMLSPKRQENQEVNQKEEDTYLSPFSDEFIERAEERDKEFEQEQSEQGAMSSNRIQAFLMLAAALYVVALIVGYHNTSYSDGVPQTVTATELEGRKYLADSNEYLNYIQSAHVETVDAVESYTADLMSASELASQMKKKNEALEKKKKEVEEMNVPSQYETLHDNLKEMFNAQISMNSAAVNYASKKTNETFVVLDNINTKYEDRSETVIQMYDEAFQK